MAVQWTVAKGLRGLQGKLYKAPFEQIQHQPWLKEGEGLLCAGIEGLHQSSNRKHHSPQLHRP